jgi:hypothetical protein
MRDPLLVLTVVLAAAGMVACLLAWWVAGRAGGASPARSGILASVGSGLVTGAAVAFGALFLQQHLQEAQAESVWLANVQTSWKMAGIDFRRHDISHVNFSGKELPDTIFTKMNLEGAQFVDAVLRGAHFEGARLVGADFIGADLSTAEVSGADFAGADLRSASLSDAPIELAQSLEGAKVNAKTCWPTNFLTSVNPAILRLRMNLRVYATFVDGVKVTKPGREAPCDTPAAP